MPNAIFLAVYLCMVSFIPEVNQLFLPNIMFLFDHETKFCFVSAKCRKKIGETKLNIGTYKYMLVRSETN
jgi:hypothetical protein